MEIWETPVETTLNADLGWEEMLLAPIGDVQLGAPGCDFDRLVKHVNWMHKRGAYFLGMGEMVDLESLGNRKALRSITLYDSVENAIEDAAARYVEQFINATKHTAGKWLGLLRGHHEHVFLDGSTTESRICKALKAPFLGDCVMLKLKFNRVANTSTSCIIWAHHGTGGGVTMAAPLNKLERVTIHFDADIYLMAHQHKKVAAPIDQLCLTARGKPRLVHRTKIIACTGGFLKGYEQGTRRGLHPEGSYIEKHMLSPVALGGILLKIRPVHTNSGDRLDLNVEL